MPYSTSVRQLTALVLLVKNCTRLSDFSSTSAVNYCSFERAFESRRPSFKEQSYMLLVSAPTDSGNSPSRRAYHFTLELTSTHKITGVRLRHFVNVFLQLLVCISSSKLHSIFFQAIARTKQCSSHHRFLASVTVFLTRWAPDIYNLYCTVPNKRAKKATQYA